MSIEAELLPESMAELVDIIGLPAVIKLMETLGGTYLWVPHKLHHNHLLVNAIGPEAAQSLSEYMPGTRIELPRGAGFIRELRNCAIRRERQDGARLAELALRYKLTERQLINILNEDPANDKQQDLF